MMKESTSIYFHSIVPFRYVMVQRDPIIVIPFFQFGWLTGVLL